MGLILNINPIAAFDKNIKIKNLFWLHLFTFQPNTNVTI